MGQVDQSCNANFDFKVDEESQRSVGQVDEEPREGGGRHEVKYLGVAGGGDLPRCGELVELSDD